MKIDKAIVFSIMFFLSCLSIGFPSMAGYARSSGASSQPSVSLPAYIYEGPIPGGYITGYVLDEDGVPVPGATVSLLQKGQLWQPEKYNYPRFNYGINPQTTRIAYHDTGGFLQEGSFLFSLPLPDEYTLAAEKDGYEGSANVYIPHELLYRDTNDSVPRTFTTNITLKGYLQPAFSPEQLSYTGAIVGEIRSVPGYHAGANVSLWRDGRMVQIPNNPQSTFDYYYLGKRVDYLFEHLAPGNYTVLAEYHGDGNYGNYSKTVSVDVDTYSMRADMVLPEKIKMPPYGWPTIKFTPTIGVFSASDTRPTPAPSVLFILLSIGVVGFLMYKKNSKR